MVRKFLMFFLSSFAGLAFLPSRASAQLEMRSVYDSFDVPNSVVAADFDHDGAMDFAVSSYYVYNGGPGIEVFLGNGDGTFKRPIKYVITNGAGPLAVGDLNRDGNPDLVASSYGSNAVIILLGNGDGTFQDAVSYSMAGATGPLVLGDFNNDGKLDIATADYSTLAFICVLLGNGDGTFQEPGVVTYPPNGGFEALVGGHFTGSGNLDLAFAEGEGLSGDVVQILLGNGDGTFTISDSYSADASPGAIVATNLRNNGLTDLIVSPLDSPGPAVLLGNGDGTFQHPVYYTIGSGGASVIVAVGDMNGDGIPDLVSAPIFLGAQYGSIYIFPGKGDGTFSAPTNSGSLGFNTFPKGLALADFNGDHQLDVAVADQASVTGEYVLLNTSTVKFSPITPLHFKSQKQGTTSAPQVVALLNEGKGTLTIKSIKTTGEFGATSTCGKTVAPKTKCTISITFAPKSTGAFVGTVQINDSASSKPQVISLSGNGT